MRSVVVSAILGVVLLAVGLLGSIPAPSAAMEGSPVPTGGTPTPECSAAQIAAGEAVFVEPGQGDEHETPAGVVALNPAADERLYLSVLTLPADACLKYRYRIGAVVLFVQEGTILYTANAGSAHPNPTVMTGDNDPATDDAAPVALDVETELEAGHWVTQDRPMWYTFRNPGPGDATVAIASYVAPPWDEGDPCSGNCRTP